MSGADLPNAARGEAALRVAGEAIVLRPTFAALVAAEEELGSLFALAERAVDGRLTLGEMASLFWHCRHEAARGTTREAVGDALVERGIAAAAPILKLLLRQILSGR